MVAAFRRSDYLTAGRLATLPSADDFERLPPSLATPTCCATSLMQPRFAPPRFASPASSGHEVLLASPTSFADPNYRFNIAAVTINERGDVAVLGTVPPDAGSTARGIYVVSGPGAVRRVVRIGEAVPDAGGATFSGLISVNGFNKHFGEDLREFILPYDAVRQADDPDAVLLDFLESTYVAAAERGGWDRERLEFNVPRRA